MGVLWKKLAESVIEKSLFISSTITSITVIMIVFYLFRDASGVFKSIPVEEGNVLLINASNPVKKLDEKQVKNIFDQEIENWKEVGGNDEPIMLFRVDDIGKFYTDEELGEKFEHLAQRIEELIGKEPGIIAYIPDKYMKESRVYRRVEMDKFTLKKVLTSTEWFPTAHPAAQLGMLPLILGTLWVSFGAIVLALPFGLACAVYMAEIAHPRIRNMLKPLIELLAGIPSVVYGFFGLVVVVPIIQKTFNLPVGESALAGSILLGIMALPTIISISEDAIKTTPRAMKEASLALGANKWQTIVRVIIPYSISGITTAAILGIGRAIGETMAVLMVTGNSAVIPTSFLQPVRTIPATIAAELGEAPFGGLHFKALFFLGCILFLISLIINLTVEWIAPKQRKER
jgi:phosphate transport system permease protein